MKSCPICKTPVFDDMDTCFGCMYVFGSKPELEQVCDIQLISTPGLAVKEKDTAPADTSRTSAAVIKQDFTQNFSGGEWTMRIELGRFGEKHPAWAMEFAAPCMLVPKDYDTQPALKTQPKHMAQ